MDLSPDQQDLEQVAASLVERTIVVAHRLAELAVDDERYDEAAAIVAAACANEATVYLPLPEAVPEDGFGEADLTLVSDLCDLADALDGLGRCSSGLRQIRDRHMAALHVRDASVALRNALLVEEGAAG
ncbi:hypothetical protein ACFRAR_14795 [Kitasatospora sp. NPDC056651]|uniref:hypothetical protein n=1 Tax=Kitasatospora sp. NPDC056651 TaxID=3345892 RepID=UPI003687ED3E